MLELNEKVCRVATRVIDEIGSTTTYLKQTTPLIPLVLMQDETMMDYNKHTIDWPRRYYLWLFGTTVRLPFESMWENKTPGSMRGPIPVDFDASPDAQLK